MTRAELAPEVKQDLRSWAGCVAGATIDEQYVAAIVEVTVGEKTIGHEGAATQLGLEADSHTQSAIYGARVTSRKL